MPPLPVLPASVAAFPESLLRSVEGEVRLSVHDRMLYATDASLYQVEPLAVVIPASTEDAVRAVRACNAAGAPMLPRGGGTSLAGQCTNRAVVIDLSPRCTRILSVDAAGKRCRVEPGIAVDDLNDALAARGGAEAKLFFAPDPATSRHANVGGCIGNNAAGARSILFGRTSESVLGIDVALADGTMTRLEAGAGAGDPVARRLAAGVIEIVRSVEGLIRERFPKTVRRNAGYGLDMVLQQLDQGATAETLNLAPLLCGSEGTLAVTLGAELRLHDRPAAKGLAVLGFPSVDAAIERVVPILRTGPSAVELLDDTVIDLAKSNIELSAYVDLMPKPPTGTLRAVLYVEYLGASPAEVEAKFRALAAVADASAMTVSMDAAAMLKLWKLRKSGEPLLHGVAGHRKPITFIEDNAIPVENLSRFVRELREIVTTHGTTAAYYAHASVGVLHVRPLIDIHDEGDRERLRSIAVQAADLARRLGGVMSGEHGDGRVRSPLLERFYGPEIMEAFRRVKRLFDPRNLLNPGNIVEIGAAPARDVPSITEALRVRPDGRDVVIPAGIETYFDYDDQHGFDGAVEMCSGAGVCRKKQGGTMCPSYMATLDERHSTRGRGNALRLAISGQFAEEGGVQPGGGAPVWDDAGTIETLRLCLSCKACKTECPSNVDVARLKAEYTAQRYREKGTPLAARIMGSVRLLNKMGSVLPEFANAAAKSGLGRHLAGAVLGIDPRRSLPAFAPSLRSMWKPGAATGKPRVLLFGDCFTMYNEPGIGLATRRVLEACGYDVVLANAGCCGRAKISLGLLGEARSEIEATMDKLLALAQQPGVMAIVVAEPSCLSAIKDDWRQLKLSAPAEARKRLAAMAYLPEEFVEEKWEEHPQRPTFRPAARAVMFHGHCHQKALWGPGSSSRALARVAGSSLKVLDTGCCGMAGSFGYTKDRYDLSMKIGELGLLPAVRGAPEATVCATGTSCRHQVHDGAGRAALHPIEFLADHLEA